MGCRGVLTCQRHNPVWLNHVIEWAGFCDSAWARHPRLYSKISCAAGKPASPMRPHQDDMQQYSGPSFTVHGFRLILPRPPTQEQVTTVKRDLCARGSQSSHIPLRLVVLFCLLHRWEDRGGARSSNVLNVSHQSLRETVWVCLSSPSRSWIWGLSACSWPELPSQGLKFSKVSWGAEYVSLPLSLSEPPDRGYGASLHRSSHKVN